MTFCHRKSILLSERVNDMFLAWKEIRYAKLRYGLIVGIMILVGYVVFMLSGLANGLADGNRTAIDDWGHPLSYYQRTAIKLLMLLSYKNRY